MEDGQHAVCGGPDVQLHVAGAEAHRRLERGDRVLRLVGARAPVGDDEGAHPHP